jgi:DNA-binding transcriptional ArsR family regulator
MTNLDAAFAALADPTRRAILARLARGETTVMDLAEPFAMTQPAVSRHLRVLEGAGLILRRIEGSKRPCRLAPHAIAEVDQWLAMLRDALSKNYDRLDQLLAATTGAKKPTSARRAQNRTGSARAQRPVAVVASRGRAARGTRPVNRIKKKRKEKR